MVAQRDGVKRRRGDLEKQTDPIADVICRRGRSGRLAAAYPRPSVGRYSNRGPKRDDDDGAPSGPAPKHNTRRPTNSRARGDNKADRRFRC